MKTAALTKKLSIETAAADIQAQLADEQLAEIYAQRIRSQRTRRFALAENPRKPTPAVAIQHTLLGIELKIGQRRLSCPDWATARYLAVFARLGVAEIAVPYDITQVSTLADELESSWFRMLALIEHFGQGQTGRWRGLLLQSLRCHQRDAIAASGAGATMPEFIQNTKQRRQ